MEKNKKIKKINIIVGIIIGILLASTATMSILYATKQTEPEEKKETFTVFYSASNENIYSEEVESGKSVSNVPSIPSKTGYSGVWSNDGNNIVKDTVIYAMYSADIYTFSLNTTNVNCLTSVIPTHIIIDDVVTLEFKAQSILYELPETISVTGAEYVWKPSYGLLTISKATSDVTINIVANYAPQELKIFYLDNPGAESYVQVEDNDKIYITDQTMYATAYPNESVYMYSETERTFLVKKIDLFTLENTVVYDSNWVNEHDCSFETEVGYKYYLEYGWYAS